MGLHNNCTGSTDSTSIAAIILLSLSHSTDAHVRSENDSLHGSRRSHVSGELGQSSGGKQSHADPSGRSVEHGQSGRGNQSHADPSVRLKERPK